MGVQEKKNAGNFMKGAAALSIASLLVKILGVMYKIPLARLLLDDGMSYFNSAYTVYSFFFILCSAGVPKAITILISNSAEKEEGNDNKVLCTALIFFFLLGIILSLIFVVFALPISDFIGSKKTVFSMLAIAPAIPFIAAISVLRGYLNGKLKFVSVAASQFIEAALKLILGLVFAFIAIKRGCSRDIISAYAISGITVGSVITFIYSGVMVKIVNKDYKSRQMFVFAVSQLKKICSISMPVTASAAMMTLVNIIDLTIIMRGLNGLGYGEYASSVLYGNYTTLAVPMFNFALSITTSICTSLLPILTESVGNRNYEAFSSNLAKAGELSAFIAAPATAIFMFLPKETLTVLFESDSVAIGAFLLSLLSFSVILIAALTVTNTALEAVGRYNIVLFSMMVGSIIKLTSSWFLVGGTELALWGAPLGTSLSYIVSLSISLLACKFARIPVGIFDYFLKFGATAICSAIFTSLLKRIFGWLLSTAFTSFIMLTIYSACYLVCVILLYALPKKSKFI